MLNPFYNLAFSLIIVLSFFFLKWSLLFSKLSAEIYIFLFILFFVSFFAGRFYKIQTKFILSQNEGVNFNFLFLISCFFFVLDFWYIGEIPLVNIILGSGNYYKDLEHIPSVYPIISAISVFLIVYYFYQFVSFKNKKHLAYGAILLTFLILNVGRGLVVMSIIPCLLIYLSQLDFKKSYKKIVKLSLILFCLTYLFGLLGDIRAPDSLKEKNTDIKEIILKAGQATDGFRNSILPSEMFWIYLYVASPISNFDNAVAKNQINSSSLSEFIVYNFMPQSLQKRLLGEFEKDKNYLVVDTFNVSTMFSLPYFQFGWFGVYFFLLFYFLLFFIYFLIVKSSNYKVVFLAFFSTSFIVGWFSNALVLDVIFAPILICVILSIKSRLK